MKRRHFIQALAAVLLSRPLLPPVAAGPEFTPSPWQSKALYVVDSASSLWRQMRYAAMYGMGPHRLIDRIQVELRGEPADD